RLDAPQHEPSLTRVRPAGTCLLARAMQNSRSMSSLGAGRWAALVFFVGVVGCGEDASTPRPDAGPPRSGRDFPIQGISNAEVTGFSEGDNVFDTVFQASDGLGPLFVVPSCGICHLNGGRGPGFVMKMSIVEADGFTPSGDQSALPWGHTVRTGLA